MAETCVIGDVTVGDGAPLAVIAGPCALEGVEMALEIGRAVGAWCRELGLSYVFKASFDKANRTSVGSGRGPGLADGLAQLAEVRAELGVPVVTDVHLPEQARRVAAVADCLQIPAFLCRQTDLLVACGEAALAHGRAVSVKKGQFLSPGEMAGPVGKLASVGCHNVMLIERGTFFGYHRLVNDFLGLGDLMELTVDGEAAGPVCFDCTHSTQLPGATETTGGRPERAPLLARAAVAAGVPAVFLECHRDPAEATSDSATMLRLDSVHGLLKSLASIDRAVRGSVGSPGAGVGAGR
jgi:2-dehydro-3-deoxyphosphooctonate aldolase (KDO 8-P synthase)